MNVLSLSKISTHWQRVSADFDIADIAFLILRLVIFIGGVGWLIFTDIPFNIFQYSAGLFAYFAVYSFIIFLFLFIVPSKKKFIYNISLFFDLLFVTLLVRVTGGFMSSFFTGFYLITALYAFYFGLIYGSTVAAISGLLYFVSTDDAGIYKIHWTDFIVRVSFLFLIAVPIGLLSEKIKKDKERIENLNKDLEESIEKLKNIQDRLIQSEKLSALGRLTADVAHEIRNPLTSIGGFARRLHKKLSPGSREKEYAEIVISEVDRLERILRDVLIFSRQPKYSMKPQRINNIVRDAIKTFDEVCKEQSIEIIMNIDDTLPDVRIDREEVRVAVDNLISNAIDAMPDGGKLTISTYMQEMYGAQYVTIRVSDTGIGLKKELIDLIFEPFYTTKEIGIGTGLGLSICKNIMDEHNGLIFVESKEGEGTSFTLLFPYQSPEDDKKIKCWEFHKCGVEKAEGAANMRCPAYPHYGRICWVIAGTFCGKKVSGAIAQKLGDCKKCEFYKRVVVKKDI